VLQLLDGWPKLGFLPKLAVLLLALSAVPFAIWLLGRSWRVGTQPHQAGLDPVSSRIPAWVLMEAAAFLVALPLFWFGWVHRLDAVDCAGPACAEAESELSALHADLLVFLIIPVLGVLTWVLANRRRSGQS